MLQLGIDVDREEGEECAEASHCRNLIDEKIDAPLPPVLLTSINACSIHNEYTRVQV